MYWVECVAPSSGFLEASILMSLKKGTTEWFWDEELECWRYSNNATFFFDETPEERLIRKSYKKAVLFVLLVQIGCKSFVI